MQNCLRIPAKPSKCFGWGRRGGGEEVTNLGWCCPNRRTRKSEYAWIIPGTKILPEWLLAAGMEWRPDASSYFEFPRLLPCVFAHEVLDGLNMEEWFLRGEEQCEYSIIIHKRTILKWGNCLALRQQFCIFFLPLPYNFSQSMVDLFTQTHTLKVIQKCNWINIVPLTENVTIEANWTVPVLHLKPVAVEMLFFCVPEVWGRRWKTVKA